MKPQREKPLLRLADAEPLFYDYAPNREVNPDAPRDRRGIGILFDCPIHEDCRVGVHFANPLDGEGPVEFQRGGWRRSGETAEDLTLEPSILVLGGPRGCEWHGFIRSGNFENCGDSK